MTPIVQQIHNLQQYFEWLYLNKSFFNHQKLLRYYRYPWDRIRATSGADQGNFSSSSAEKALKNQI